MVAEHSHRPRPFADVVRRAFAARRGLLMICATGIAMRVLAPVLGDKRRDPPVLVMDDEGRFVVPLLGAHSASANGLARQLADMCDARAVLSSASPHPGPVYALGMGCVRGCALSGLEAVLGDCLDEAQIHPEQVAALHSIDCKADEVAMGQLAGRLRIPFCTHSAERLAPAEPLLGAPSEAVRRAVGVAGVAESAALVGAWRAAGAPARLIVPKRASRVATCALAVAWGGGA